MNILEDYKKYLTNIKRPLIYYNFMRILFKYLKEKNIGFDEFNKDQLAEFFHIKDYSPNSINNFLKSGRDYCKYINKEKHPFYEIKLLKVDRKIPIYLTLDEIKKAITYITTYHSARLPTDKIDVLLYFMFYTCVRKGEVLSLKRSEFNFENNGAKIWGQKDKEERMVYYPDFLKEKIQTYFQSEVEKENAFNITLGEINYLTRVMSKHLGKHIKPHTIRHSGARHLVEEGVSLPVISKLLGHASIQTTLIYASADDLLVKRTLDKIYKKEK